MDTSGIEVSNVTVEKAAEHFCILDIVYNNHLNIAT